MNAKDYEQEIEKLQREVAILTKANTDLINRNLVLGQ